MTAHRPMQMLLTHQTITQRAGMSSGSTVATVKVASLKVTIHLCRQKSNPCIKLSALRSLCVEAVYCTLPGTRSSFRQIQLHIISPPRTTVDTGLPRSTHSGCMNPYNWKHHRIHCQTCHTIHACCQNSRTACKPHLNLAHVCAPKLRL